MKTLLILIFTTLSLNALACKVDAPSSINIFTDLEKGETKFFKDNNVLDKPVVFNVYGCDQAAMAKKALMISVGAEQFGWEDKKRSISFTGEYNDDKCTIANSPTPLMPFSEKFKYFKKKNDYLKKCLEIKVTQTSTRPLNFTPNQKGCIINRISNQEANFQGGYCFFKPNPDSNFQVSIKVKESCRAMSGLENILQGPQELAGAINFYVAGDDSGTSIDLTAIKSTPMTISINPLEKLMPLSFDNGTEGPRWPGQWVFPNLHLAKINLSNSGSDFYKINTPFLVDNRCQSKCVGKICSGPCDYSLPIAGEVVLKEISAGKESYLTSWYDGGFAPANWQGIVWGQGQEIEKRLLQNGKRYQIEFSVLDPKIDFDIFKNKIKKKIGSLNARLGRITSGEDIATVGQIPEISNNGNTIPTIGGVNTSIGGALGDLDGELASLHSRLSFGNWPPLYEESCSSDLTKCKRSPSYVVKYKLSFDVTSRAEGNGLPTLSNYEVERQSPYAPDYKMKTLDLPYVTCQ